LFGPPGIRDRSASFRKFWKSRPAGLKQTLQAGDRRNIWGPLRRGAHDVDTDVITSRVTARETAATFSESMFFTKDLTARVDPNGLTQYLEPYLEKASLVSGKTLLKQ
jgi:hypothetical protein